jgi:hypothetical protein
MCKFFSVCSMGDGKPLYFNAKIRKDIIKKKSKYETTDSHTSIADYFGHKGLDEDKLNKYEYDVWTKHLKIDHQGAKDDSEVIKDFCDNLDFTTIVPELNIKPLINPFKDIQTLEVTKNDIKLLKEWDSVRASVRAYLTTFVKTEYKYNLKPAQKLWARGLVISFDGTNWRLHGAGGKEVYKITAEELRKTQRSEG